MRNPFRLPSPKELGWTQHNSLRLEFFSPYQEGRSWEEWHTHCKQHYPVRYWVTKTLPRWWYRKIGVRFETCTAWLLDHLLPSRRHHILDLRGIDQISEYKHGYLDPSTVLWLVGWYCLVQWWESRESTLTVEYFSGPEMASMLKVHLEAKDLYEYWTVTRIERSKEGDARAAAFHAIKPTPENRSHYEAARAHWLSYFQESEKIEDEMWSRLAALRPHMW